MVAPASGYVQVSNGQKEGKKEWGTEDIVCDGRREITSCGCGNNEVLRAQGWCAHHISDAHEFHDCFAEKMCSCSPRWQGHKDFRVFDANREGGRRRQEEIVLKWLALWVGLRPQIEAAWIGNPVPPNAPHADGWPGYQTSRHMAEPLLARPHGSEKGTPLYHCHHRMFQKGLDVLPPHVTSRKITATQTTTSANPRYSSTNGVQRLKK